MTSAVTVAAAATAFEKVLLEIDLDIGSSLSFKKVVLMISFSRTTALSTC